MEDKSTFTISNEELQGKSVVQCVSEQCLSMLESDLKEYGITLEQFFQSESN